MALERKCNILLANCSRRGYPKGWPRPGSDFTPDPPSLFFTDVSLHTLTCLCLNPDTHHNRCLHSPVCSHKSNDELWRINGNQPWKIMLCLRSWPRQLGLCCYCSAERVFTVSVGVVETDWNLWKVKHCADRTMLKLDWYWEEGHTQIMNVW